jgi:hypothetical protein
MLCCCYTALRFFGALENDKGGQSRMTANKVKECLELVGRWTGLRSQIPRCALNDDEAGR